MFKWLAISIQSMGHLEVHRQCLRMSPSQRGHSHTHWPYWYRLYKRTCALCSVQWFIIQASERARLSQKRDRAKKESTCATSLRPTLLRTPRAICTSSNENSIIEESRRLREKSVSSSGKVRSYTSHLGFFGSNIARSCQNFCNVAF